MDDVIQVDLRIETMITNQNSNVGYVHENTSFPGVMSQSLDCYSSMNCSGLHRYISIVVIALSAFALLSNMMLVGAMVTWERNKTCKMFWFLWHMCLANALMAFSFVYYHGRRLAVCPLHFHYM